MEDQSKSPEQMAASALAEARGASLDSIYQRFSEDELRRCPKKFNKHIAAIRNSRFLGSGLLDGLAYVELENGRIFFSPITHGPLRREYEFVGDTLPACLTVDTYLAASDTAQRYVTDHTWPPEGIVRPEAANIIELGAYLGHKTIRFAETLARNGGRVLAVEMMPDNCEILRRNVQANGYEDVIEVCPVGVWKEAGQREIFSKGRQRNSLVALAKLADGDRLTAEVRTLDQLIDDWDVSPVDLIFVTVNGAESAALEGFDPEGREVRAFFVAAPYDVGDRPSSDICRELLRARGYEVIDSVNKNRVIARLPGHACIGRRYA